MASKRQIVIGLVGSQLDRGHEPDRWARWRPTVAICQHDELLIHRFEVLHEARDRALAEIIAADIRSVSPETEVVLHKVHLRDAWDFEEVFGELHKFALAYEFRTEHEDYFVHISTGTHVEQICLFLLAESRHLPARLLQTSPPKRNQPVAGRYRIIDLDLSRYDAIAARFALEQQEGLSYLKSGIATQSPTYNALMERIERVAIHSDAPLLLTGPTGAGKSQLARRIYELKRQRRQLEGPFVEVNCATLRGDQAMSALFGHEKGAFTGATTARPGLLRSADTGMLFLDEIGELGLDEQAMLLRAIEEKRFLPVGSDRETSSDFQLIAGTNRNLRHEVAEHTFREDLLARIDLWTFRLPSLAERREDIAPNIDYELAQFAARTGRIVRMNKEARTWFLRFAESPEATWNANFRDLNAAVRRMATLAAGGRITEEHVGEEIMRLREQWRVGADDRQGERVLESVLDRQQIDQLDLFDREQLAVVLRVCRECRSLSAAGRKLFQASRLAKKKTNDADRLRKYLARFELKWEHVFAQAGA